MEVPITEFRARLAAFIERAQAGEEVVITDRGVAVARVVPARDADRLRRLVDRGILLPPSAPKKRIREKDLVPMRGTLDDIPRDEWR